MKSMVKEKRIVYVLTLLGEDWFKITLQPASRDRLFLIPGMGVSNGRHLTIIGDGQNILTHHTKPVGTEHHTKAPIGPRTDYSKSFVEKHAHKYHFNKRAFVPTLHYFNLAKGIVREDKNQTTFYYEVIRPEARFDDRVFFSSMRIRDIQLNYPGYGFTIWHGGICKVVPLNDHTAIYEPTSQSIKLLGNIYPFDVILNYFDAIGPEEKAHLIERMKEIIHGKSKSDLSNLLTKLHSSKIINQFEASANNAPILSRK
jgi:hypothetical protein